MSDLDLIRQLEDRLGHPLEEIPEAWFERHNQAMAAWDWDSPDRIKQDSYSITGEGDVSGLFLKTSLLLARVVSEQLVDFPFWQFSQVRHLHLSQVSLSSFSWLATLKGLTSLDLSKNQISDISFLLKLQGLTSLDLSANQISDIYSLSGLKRLTSVNLSDNQISNISFLSGLKGLTSLNLSRNRVIDILFFQT